MESGETMELVLNGDNESSLTLTKNLEAEKLTNEKKLLVAWVSSANMMAID